jgi:hypothetical protein
MRFKKARMMWLVVPAVSACLAAFVLPTLRAVSHWTRFSLSTPLCLNATTLTGRGYNRTGG